MSTLRPIVAIVHREYLSYFRTLHGWIVVALFLFLSGLFVQSAIKPGEPASLRDFFTVWRWLLIVVSPAITMRLFSEEFRTGTIEPLGTAPVGESTVVFSKFLSAVLFLVTMLAPTLSYPVLMCIISDPSAGPIVSGYVGVILLGGLYLAVGTLLSTLTSSQTLAFLSTLVVILGVELLVISMAPKASPRIAELLYASSPGLRMPDFARGILSVGNMMFFLAMSFWFLIGAVLCLQSRRWR